VSVQLRYCGEQCDRKAYCPYVVGVRAGVVLECKDPPISTTSSSTDLSSVPGRGCDTSHFQKMEWLSVHEKTMLYSSAIVTSRTSSLLESYSTLIHVAGSMVILVLPCSRRYDRVVACISSVH